MGILEKLRPQPRWKHADPAVRAAAVYELGPDESDALRALAREDAEARVRRAAVTRLDDLAILGDIARTDPDEDVRVEAIRALAGLAAETASVEQALESVRHLVALGRSKEVVVVARENAHAEVRAAVVDLVEDAKALGSISRHAADGPTRLRALARVSDADELVNVAVKSEHTDAAVAALERITDAEALAAVAQRARNKVAARRARTRIRQIEEAAQPAQPEPAVAMSAEDRARALALLHQTEALVAHADPDEAASALSQLRLGWAELHADVDLDEALRQQFDAASDAVREAVAERQQERVADGERAEALAKEQADRLAIVEAIDQLSGEAAQDRIAELRVRWDALPPMPSEYAASLTRRFQDVSRAFEDRERRRILAEAAVGRLGTLATELEQLVASEQPVDEIVARWRGLRRDADVLREHASANPQAAERLEQAVAALEEKEQQHQQLRTRQEQDNLRRLQQLGRQLETLAAGEQITLKAGDRALRDIRAALDERAPLPSKKDRQDVQAKLEEARARSRRAYRSCATPTNGSGGRTCRCRKSSAAKWKRSRPTENLEAAGRRMRELQAAGSRWPWRRARRARRMWRRFKTAQDEVFGRTAAHFAAQNEERTGNLARKSALCERAEALADSSDWVKTATEIQALQAEWKTIGAGDPRPREGGLGAVPRRLRSLLHPSSGRPQAPQGRLVGQPHAQGSALRTGRDAGRLHGVGGHRHAVEAAAGRVEDHRTGAQGQVGSGLAAVPHRLRPVLRSLQAPRPGGPAGEGSCPRHPDSRARAAGTGGRCRGAAGARQPRRPHSRRALPLAAGAGTAARAAAGPGRALSRRRSGGSSLSGRRRSPAPISIPTRRASGWKSCSRASRSWCPTKPVRQGPMSPTELLAQQWRDRLASNTMTGGRSGENDDARWRAAEQEVRNAQSQWMRLGPVPADVAGPLNERFQRACRRFYDSRRRAS